MSHECKTSRRGWCISGMRPPRVPFLFLSTTAAASSAWVSEWSQWPNNPQWAYSMSIIKPLSFEATELWDLFVLQQNLNYPDWCTSYMTLNELLIFSEPQFLHLQYHGDMKMIFLHLGLRNQKKIISIEYLAEPPTFDCLSVNHSDSCPWILIDLYSGTHGLSLFHLSFSSLLHFPFTLCRAL